MSSIRACIYRLAVDFFPRVFFDFQPVVSRKQSHGKKILIACSHFWPSIGGVESRVEQFSAELVSAGYDVFIITPALSGRSADTRNGVPIISVRADKRIKGLYPWPYAVRAAVISGEFDACIIIQDPRGDIIWTVENLPAQTRTKLIIQPIITAEGFEQWQAKSNFKKRLAKILSAADAAVAMTRTGPDVRFMLSAGLSPSCIPNATKQPVPVKGFRKRYGIDENAFLILHVANLWGYKNHTGLIDALNSLPDSWRLVLIGNPTTELECAKAVEAKLSKCPEILYLSGLNRQDVSSAMYEADVIVLPSHGEGSPNTILEAMAHGKPWLATPKCGGAIDNAGGIICPVSEFMEYLLVLYENSDLRLRLGAIGHRHWQACFSWEKVTLGWIDLIESNQLNRNFAMPTNISAEMSSERIRLSQLLYSRLNHSQINELAAACPVENFVNIGMITYNRLEFTRQVIQALLALDAGYQYALTVVDNGSNDGTREYLQELKENQIIKNLVLLDENVGVAKASNLAWSMEPLAGYYLKLDNDIVIRKSGWLGKMVDVVNFLPEAGAVAYNFEPVSYPLVSLQGISVRPKLNRNLGGACILIPKRTHDLLGFWCEDYGLYGEEDTDFGVRVEYSGQFNLYMEEEEIGFHLPAGRAAKIGFLFRARDGVEEFMHADYRAWKDKTRRSNMKSGIFKRNISNYSACGRSLFLRSRFVEEWRKSNQNIALGDAISKHYEISETTSV